VTTTPQKGDLPQQLDTNCCAAALPFRNAAAPCCRYAANACHPAATQRTLSTQLQQPAAPMLSLQVPQGIFRRVDC
jgi:hypothetical protein